ncbi:putative ATP-dependent RNA helicase DQX1 [Sesbania bispinosa]|nr:putative ATP-dependent RNA helicase DQX1 [Sesbania bispinosa]
MANKKTLHLKRDSCLQSARVQMPWIQPKKDIVRKVTEPIQKKRRQKSHGNNLKTTPSEEQRRTRQP